ncbi:hypothetical protein BC826DRAFT_1188281 [Russula brevipes]|nr:hypothetical protein BC826DRAFT_1188281 [Russula brevipes]
MAMSLSALTRLEMLKIGFHWESPRPHPDQLSPPRSTRTILPALNVFEFEGFSEYLEALISHTDAPLLRGLHIKFFSQPIFNTPQLCSLISHAEKLRSPSRACIRSQSYLVDISLTSAGHTPYPPFSLAILCQTPNQQVPCLTQVCNSPFFTLFNLERLEICEWRVTQPQWRVNARNTQWLELLRRFTTVKSLSLRLCKESAPRLVPALQELSGERIMDVLPALQSIFLSESLLSGPVEEALAHFLTVRQLSGHPVAVNPPGQK